ncbi:hypothetical protein [Mycolicibacterium cosmeticum]|uniref:hypothetical protein n=1 Tax=Mycolicibacterium cosmeticum TaxID=258533 RepID=UPI003204DD06
MRDPNQRLVRLKVAFIAVVLAGVGFGLMVFDNYLNTTQPRSVFAFLPFGELGGGLFITGVASIWIDKWVSGDQNATLEKLLEKVLVRVLGRLAPSLRDAVIQAFADNVDNLSVVATPEFLDRLARNALTLRLGDRTFAEDIYEDVRDQAIAAAERWHDTTISLDLSPLSTDRGAESGTTTPLFVLTARYEYRVKPVNHVRRFTAVSDMDDYRGIMADPGETSAWYINPATGLTGQDKAAFELVQFSVDGEERSIRRTVRAGSQTYSVTVGKDIVDAGQFVTVAYTYRTVLRQSGHMLYVDVEQPSKGLDVALDYGDCGIAEMRLIPFIASSQKVRNHQTPDSVPERSAGIGFDGWVFPRSGVVAVWILNRERS